MEEAITVFDVIRILMLCFSPMIFLVGILLLVLKVEQHADLENKLGKDIGGIKKRILPSIETNIFTFQNWLVKRSRILGIFFIVYAIFLFLFFWKGE